MANERASYRWLGLLKTPEASRDRKRKPKTGRPRAEEVAFRGQTLRDAAFEVILEFGYEKAKLGEIVKRTGSSKETLYAQYANNEELFKAVICKNLEAPFVQLKLLVTTHLLPLETSLKACAGPAVIHGDRRSLAIHGCRLSGGHN